MLTLANVPAMQLEVLRLLAALEESHGLALIQASEASGGKLKRGTLYAVLQKMEAEYLIESREEERTRPETQLVRRLYKLTTIGRRLVQP